MHRSNILSLLAVLALAAVVTTAVSGRVTARAMFQVSPPDTQSPLWPTMTLPAETPIATLPAEAPTVVPPQDTPQPDAASDGPVVPGFLPAPTLTNPDELRSNPPVVYRPTSAPPEPTPEPAPTPMTLAGLIREGIVALSYLWLCIGVALLIGLGAAVVWLVRRTQSHG